MSGFEPLTVRRRTVPLIDGTRFVLKLPDLEQSKSAVLNSLTSRSSQRSHDHAIREFIDWYCGLRPSESRPCGRNPAGQGRKEAWHVKVAVDRWLTAAGISTGQLFRAINKANRIGTSGFSPKAIWGVVKAGSSKCGLDRVAPHDLRRTCARLCHEAGGELEQIQFLPGHVRVQTTERYLGCKQWLRNAVNDKNRPCVPRVSERLLRNMGNPTVPDQNIHSGRRASSGSTFMARRAGM